MIMALLRERLDARKLDSKSAGLDAAAGKEAEPALEVPLSLLERLNRPKFR